MGYSLKKRGSKTALVTGAARGLGRQYAQLLAEAGYNLVLVGRGRNIFDAAGEIGAAFPELQLNCFLCDLSKPEAADAVFAFTQGQGIDVDVLVNNAAIFNFCDVTATSDEKIATMLTLHNLTLVRLCRLYGAQMALRGAGYILNMSSYSIWMPFPGLSLYSATKAFVRNFSVAFAKELREKGVYVTAVCPAGIATDMYGLSKRLQNLGVKLGVLITPRRCAHKGLKALFRGRKLVVPDWWFKPLIPLMMHLPSCLERFVRRKMMRFQK